MPDRIFIDSNIWIYFFLESTSPAEKEKYRKAVALISRLDSIFISTQVLNETANVLHRRYKFSLKSIEVCVKKILSICEVAILNEQNTLHALTLMRTYSFSFYDALIVSTAIGSSCRFIYSEDLHHNLNVENYLLIQNPFFL